MSKDRPYGLSKPTGVERNRPCRRIIHERDWFVNNAG